MMARNSPEFKRVFSVACVPVLAVAGETSFPDATKLTVHDILLTCLNSAELCILRQRQHEKTTSMAGEISYHIVMDSSIL